MFPEIPVGRWQGKFLGGKDISHGSYNVQMATRRAVYMDLASMLGEQAFCWIFVVFMHDGSENHLALEQASDYFHDLYGGSLVHLWDLKPVHDCCNVAEKGAGSTCSLSISYHSCAAKTPKRSDR
jgi:hypothetical protein